MEMLSIKTINLVLCSVIFFWLPQLSTSFSTTGHFIVARIAEKELLKQDFYSNMMDLLSVLGEFTKEKKYPFVEAATWADEIKYLGWNSMNYWHYENTYISDSSIISSSDYPSMGLTKNSVNIVWAINSAKTTLRNTRTSLADDRLGKSINLRMLIHLVGDIHQPLHTCTLVNSEFPNGDSGGNKFVIDMPGARNLHSYWDRCLKKYSILKSPLSDLHFEKLEGYVDQIMADYPRSNDQIKDRLTVTSVRSWANEGVKYCQDYVYDGISSGQAPTQTYIDRGTNLIDQQLAVAGYRLADTLAGIFSDPKTLENHVKLTKQSQNDVRADDDQRRITDNNHSNQGISEIFQSKILGLVLLIVIV